MSAETVLITILAMGLVTYLPRLLPTQLLVSRQLPPTVEAWLRLVPVAVMAALVLPSVVPPTTAQEPQSSGALFLWASLATVLVAWRTRSLLGSVAVGVATVALARLASSVF